jgi:hypothetical protein
MWTLVPLPCLCPQVVDGHGGFKRIAAWIRADQRTTLTWLVALLTFGMSAVLDNLTTTIVLLSILQASAIFPSSKACMRVCRYLQVSAATARHQSASNQAVFAHAQHHKFAGQAAAATGCPRCKPS